MINIPAPQTAKINLFHAGVNHVSEYTGTSIGRVSYGSKRIWQAVYTWDIVNRATAKQLYTALYTLGTGQGEIPLFFYDKPEIEALRGLNGDLPSMYVKNGNNHFPTRTVAQAIDKPATTSSGSGSTLILKSGMASNFELEPFDKLQVGDYCLEIVSVTGDSLVVANMPNNLTTKIQDSDNVTINRFYMIGQNVSEIIGYEMAARKGNNNYNPETVEFKEIII